MPSRQLPNSQSQRDKAFLTAHNKYNNTPVGNRLLSAAQYTEWLDLTSAGSLYSRWKKERDEAAGALSGQTGFADDLPGLTRGLRLQVSHFIQNLSNAVVRGALPASVRALFHLAVSEVAVPPLDSEADLLLWSERIAEGEADRVAAGGVALAWPSAGEVAAARAAYLAVANPQSTALDAAHGQQQEVLALVPAADGGIKKMWDTVEYQLGQQNLAGPALRTRARQWGVVYDSSEGEDDGGGSSSSSSSGPSLPGAPEGVSFVQGTPAGPVEVDATGGLPPGVSLARMYQRLVGETGDPALVAAAGSLPTSFTIDPGNYEFTMTYVNEAGEGPPCEAVVLAVA